MKRKKRKRWLYISIGLITIVCIVNVVVSFYFYDLAVERNVKDFLQGNEDLEVSAEAMDTFTKGDWRDWVREQNFETWKMETFDGLTLKGYFLEAKEPTAKTVVFAHGYLGRATDMGLFGQHYYDELGYNMLIFDMRGHGDSEGDYIGFGWHDRIDLIDWTNKVIEYLGPETEIVLHGLSMGGATVAMASGEELPSNVKAIVSDSPYTSVYDLFDYQMERMFHLPDFPILPTTSLVTKWKADYSFQEASALDQVKKAEVPILYIHGEADTFVPTRMSKKLFENTKSDAYYVTYPDSNHGESVVLHEEAYYEELDKFLKKYVTE
ncbi:alpha/beta hydrolase [Salirhabdus sp. Marseille-P4669]|uniref:alpha/beta hydrolase n=1 Tax=Salirhabdus sp. Marseille-P4669 TaxID=2042310 RepID=UPI000C7D6ADC|nr:alpha/beta hydrolase [Salirhabdus sp. Marseille-P4669]